MRSSRPLYHIGHDAQLEDQLLSFTGAAGERSPDRLDAASWAITDLRGSIGSRVSSPVAVPYTAEVTDTTVVPRS